MDEEFDMQHSIRLPNGTFDNPWCAPSFWQVFKGSIMTKLSGDDQSAIPNKAELDKTLPMAKPTFDSPESNATAITWIGHATNVVHLDKVTVITDPIFSDRAGPFSWTGPKRFRPPGCTIDELPDLHACVISHNHYDHLDQSSIKALHKRFPKVEWMVPLGLGRFFTDQGVDAANVHELDWWEEKNMKLNDQVVQFVFTPARHWSLRLATGRNKTLWGSWCVIGKTQRFYFAGDTATSPVFKEIGKKYGPFDVAAIPIGAYYPRECFGNQHVNPEEAMDIHADVKSLHSVGIHWGTFKLTFENYLEPSRRIEAERELRGWAPDSFTTLQHGQTVTFGNDNHQEKSASAKDATSAKDAVVEDKKDSVTSVV